jgi:hypothetical protein
MKICPIASPVVTYSRKNTRRDGRTDRQTDRQTDSHDEDNSRFRSFGNAPKKFNIFSSTQRSCFAVQQNTSVAEVHL